MKKNLNHIDARSSDYSQLPALEFAGNIASWLSELNNQLLRKVVVTTNSVSQSGYTWLNQQNQENTNV